MKLILKDGTVYEGEGFGANPPAGGQSGEVVFNTGMVGYVESLTDPSYAGQILVLTYPLIGNYGVPDKKYWESKRIQVAGLVVSEYSENYSHHLARRSLGEWLKSEGVPAITGIDTRALTQKLREHGVMLGALEHAMRRRLTTFIDPNEENLVARVSIKKKQILGNGKKTIVAVDCGMKENIIRSLRARGVRVLRVPWDYDFTNEKYDALLLSNGPGDPTACEATIVNIRRAMAQQKPILGICLGNQLLALAAGAKTYKLKYGHRSQNQPCILAHTSHFNVLPAGRSLGAGGQNIGIKAGRCFITSQNHGYAVDAKTLPSDWEEWFTNANDGSNEGIRHRTKPWQSVQFHPEAAPGPTDANWIFDDFLSHISGLRNH